MKNDIQIQRDVLASLEHDDNVPNGCLGVEVHHGVVKLAGRSVDSTTKQSAELAAKRVEGVSKVLMDVGVGQR